MDDNTHPNAFRQEAQVKRTQAAQLANEADQLEAKAKELEKAQSISSSTTSTEDTTLPEGGRTYTPEPEQIEQPKNKLFNKK